ncbi:MAG TPA: protein-glutamate O-methyltransferase CheR [Thermoanaerobaculia bacterium]|nr:protein-glutamate O-methyltransferase CheR [Thermoanaerobaculia bacterium]
MTANGHGPFPNDLYRVFADMIRARSGIDFTESNRFLLEARVRHRVEELRLDGPRAYLYRLRYGPGEEAEFDALIDRVTNPETYFFRESEQLAAFTEDLLPEWEAQGEAGPLRIWSAGCASGEEPYTIAMLLEEKGFFARHSVEIFGSDLSMASLARARAGIFRENAFRQTSPERRNRFFEEEAPGRLRLREEVRGRVAFGRVNLVEGARLAALPRFHVIFCRNVLIYLAEGAKRSVVTSLHDRLLPGGHLFLGRVESLVAFSTPFRLRHLSHDLAYRK